MFPRILLSLTGLTVSLLPAIGDDGWLTDFEAAKARAAERQTDLLLNFTGSDWCPPCMRLKAEVVRQIETVDPEDESGFREGREYRQAVRDHDKQIEAIFVIKRHGQAIQSVDAFLAEHEPTGRDKQHLLMPKVMANVELGRKEEAFAAIEEIREAAPESELSGQLDDIKVRIEQYIRDNKAAPAEETPPAPAPERR